MRSRSKIGAYILILIGIVFLFVNLEILPIPDLRLLVAKWWPLILILVGVALLGRPRKGDS
jgi:cell wall-active antibiotic response 4TMS protein YvqF